MESNTSDQKEEEDMGAYLIRGTGGDCNFELQRRWIYWSFRYVALHGTSDYVVRARTLSKLRTKVLPGHVETFDQLSLEMGVGPQRQVH